MRYRPVKTLGGCGRLAPKPAVCHICFSSSGSWELGLFCPLRGLGLKHSGIATCPGRLSSGSEGNRAVGVKFWGHVRARCGQLLTSGIGDTENGWMAGPS